LDKFLELSKCLSTIVQKVKNLIALAFL
jgi:hypothetical protein